MTEYPWTTCGYRRVDGRLEYFSEKSANVDLKLSQDSAIRLQNSVDILREIIAGHEAVIRREITAVHINRVQDAVEGYCEGLAIDEETARAILFYALTGSFEDEKQNYNCPCLHPSQCTGFCMKPSERGSAA